MTPDFEKLFPAIGNCVKQTLADIPAPSGVVYACGFWLFYTDFTVIREPCFAYNVVGREGDAKWSPPEWAVDVEDHIVEALTRDCLSEFGELKCCVLH